MATGGIEPLLRARPVVRACLTFAVGALGLAAVARAAFAVTERLPPALRACAAAEPTFPRKSLLVWAAAAVLAAPLFARATTRASSARAAAWALGAALVAWALALIAVALEVGVLYSPRPERLRGSLQGVFLAPALVLGCVLSLAAVLAALWVRPRVVARDAEASLDVAARLGTWLASAGALLAVAQPGAPLAIGCALAGVALVASSSWARARALSWAARVLAGDEPRFAVQAGDGRAAPLLSGVPCDADVVRVPLPAREGYREGPLPVDAAPVVAIPSRAVDLARAASRRRTRAAGGIAFALAVIAGAAGPRVLPRSPRTLARLQGATSATALAIDGAHLIVAVGPDVFAVPKAGGPAVRIAQVDAVVRGLATDGDQLLVQTSHRIWRVPKAGGEAVVLVDGPPWLGRMAVADGAVFYEARLDPETYEVRSVGATGGGTPARIGPSIGCSSLAVVRDAVFVAGGCDAPKRLVRIARRGGVASVVRELHDGQLLGSDGEGMFLGATGYLTVHREPTLVRIDARGATTAVLAEGGAAIGAFAAHGGRVAWFERGVARRGARDCFETKVVTSVAGVRRELATRERFHGLVAVDEDAVYLAREDDAGTSVLRLP